MEPTREIQPKKFKIDTPVGSLETYSGNHIVDVLSIVMVVIVLYIGKHLFDKKFK